jgi:hypothetical protein
MIKFGHLHFGALQPVLGIKETIQKFTLRLPDIFGNARRKSASDLPLANNGRVRKAPRPARFSFPNPSRVCSRSPAGSRGSVSRIAKRCCGECKSSSWRKTSPPKGVSEIATPAQYSAAGGRELRGIPKERGTGYRRPVFDFRVHFCHSASMETHAFGFRLRPTPRRTEKRFPISWR